MYNNGKKKLIILVVKIIFCTINNLRACDSRVMFKCLSVHINDFYIYLAVLNKNIVTKGKIFFALGKVLPGKKAPKKWLLPFFSNVKSPAFLTLLLRDHHSTLTGISYSEKNNKYCICIITFSHKK